MSRVKLVSVTNGAGEFVGRGGEELIVAKARISSDKDDLFEKPDRLLRYLINKAHWSPFDMADITVQIECEQAISLQLLRHWTIKPQQFSQRFAEVPWEPYKPVMRMKGSSNRQGSLGEAPSHIQDIADESIQQAYETYVKLLESGVAPESARFVLPTASKTKLHYKGSARSFITFLNSRLHCTTQKEMRDLAQEIRDIFLDQFPIISKALNHFKGAEIFPILDQVVVMNNLENIEAIKQLWNND